MYWAFFLRQPDASGLAHWLGLYESGQSLNTIAGKFARSSEFKNTYGPLSDAAFVDLVYTNVLRRPADAAGSDYWVQKLQHGGVTRGAMMSKFSESSEGTRVLAPQVDILLVHLGLLRKLPSNVQFDGWLDNLRKGTESAQALADELRQTSAYVSRLK
jgi:hypothetical protein